MSVSLLHWQPLLPYAPGLLPAGAAASSCTYRCCYCGRRRCYCARRRHSCTRRCCYCARHRCCCTRRCCYSRRPCCCCARRRRSCRRRLCARAAGAAPAGAAPAPAPVRAAVAGAGPSPAGAGAATPPAGAAFLLAPLVLLPCRCSARESTKPTRILAPAALPAPAAVVILTGRTEGLVTTRRPSALLVQPSRRGPSRARSGSLGPAPRPPSYGGRSSASHPRPTRRARDASSRR